MQVWFFYASPAVTSVTNNEYDPHQRLSNKVHTIGSKTFSKTLGYTLTRPTSLTDKFGDTTISVTTYEYDAMGRIIKEKDGNGKVLKAYTYDEYGQLKKESNYTLDKTFQYEYNGIGNIESVKTYAHVNGKPGLTGTTTQFTYGNTTHPDRLTQVGYQSIIYDANGCPTRYGDKIFVWNKGKLVRIYDDIDPNSSDSSENVEFAYNGYGQRVSKTYEYDPGPDYTGDFLIDANVTYTYDNAGRLIREVREESYTESADVTYDIMYLYDESSIIGCTIKRGDLDYGTYYFQRNLLGDVVAIYDTAGTKVEGYAYDAFGNCTLLNNSLVGKLNPIRYRGYYFDTETGWYFLNARYYAPELRRFISPDDTAYLDPESVNGLNLYCYCNNDPINYCDPSGHGAEWWQWTLFGIGAALVVVAAGMAILGTGGVAAFGMGALIGSASVGAVGAGIGAAVGYATGGVDGILGGALAGFGIGAIAGFAIGGAMGYANYHISKSLLDSYKLPQWDGYDCSEIADDLYRIAHQKGKIINITPRNAHIFNVYGLGDDFIYHTVYSRGMFILDPRYSTTPIFKFKYMQALRALNKGIKFLITRG